jgi:hypothetical protein
MRNFAYINPDFIKNEVVPELVENNPCYQQGKISPTFAVNNFLLDKSKEEQLAAST